MIIELEDFLIEIRAFNRGNSSGLPASLVIFGDGSGYVQDGRDKLLVSFSSYSDHRTDEQRLEIVRSIND